MIDPLRASCEQAAVVIPAHNEVRCLPKCLRAMRTAVLAAPIPVTTVVVLDSCDDGSADLAARFGPDTHFVTVEAGNVGAARAAGFAYARSLTKSTDGVWYACTDADSRVDPDWLVRQLSARADMVLGVVRVADWRQLAPKAITRYLRAYRGSRSGSGTQGHDHVHGANMGFRSEAYWRVGGFAPLPTGEDVALVRRFEEHGYRIHRDAGLSVTTSARRDGRAPGGFADHLRDLSRETPDPA
ncbi:glycosyltransferase [Mycolicibacterium palauense]|uniref:glycosyltransferase n=1 Tax=Mycolicibacterium palauense TaxID=2034511 RepID=UPI000BFF18F1|nr:glycosyltransferase [Mycolicibacterium palauense]